MYFFIMCVCYLFLFAMLLLFLFYLRLFTSCYYCQGLFLWVLLIRIQHLPCNIYSVSVFYYLLFTNCLYALQLVVKYVLFNMCQLCFVVQCLLFVFFLRTLYIMLTVIIFVTVVYYSLRSYLFNSLAFTICDLLTSCLYFYQCFLCLLVFDAYFCLLIVIVCFICVFSYHVLLKFRHLPFQYLFAWRGSPESAYHTPLLLL